MNYLNEIIKFVKDYSGIKDLNSESDIFDLGVVGDDFHEMIEKYSEKYQVDISEYLWYFHADEEGHGLGAIFFKPPHERVVRIPVTPGLLSEFAKTKKWEIDYPEHYIPEKRIDIIINRIIAVLAILFLIIIWILK